MKNFRLISAWMIALMVVGLISPALAQDLKIDYFRPYDQSGLNVFETTKESQVPFDGLKVRLGGNFTQQFQSLSHSTEADDRFSGEVNLNELTEIAPGFNLATANLNIDVQLADGIRMNLITYLSARHHTEAWVKGGFVQIDRMPFFNSEKIDRIMDFVTVKVGHMEINYGDAHFRRTDNGNSLYNPFVGNLIMDAFTTEIGGEIYVQANGFLGMVGATNGEIKGNINPNPTDANGDPLQKGDDGYLAGRSPAILAKLGYDKQLNDDLRVRLTGSLYTTSRSASNTLYGGDRAGSRYYMVMEPAQMLDWRTGNIVGSSTAANFTSGRMNPGFRSAVTAIMVNPFVKFKGLELFGTYENATGRAANETDTRTWNQYAVDLVYRFLKNESLYVAGRYNTVTGPLSVGTDNVSINRVQVGAGWFVTPNLLVKGEYVNQQYNDFVSSDIRHEGQFNGVVFEAAVGF